MVRKKLTRIFASCLTAALLVGSAGMPVRAEELADTDVNTEAEPVSDESIFSDNEISLENLVAVQSENEADPMAGGSEEAISRITQTPNVESAALENAADLNLNGKSLDTVSELGELALPADTRSAASITQSFTDILTAEGQMKLVQFSLGEGDIVNASLVCPNNANLNYDILLASVGADGSLTLMKSCGLGTYIDPNTEKTVDEGISYVHNQATVGNFALIVVATSGSSSTDTFTLTISLDAAGSFDSNEPNDSAFDAASISGTSASGSLHVENDQDWYVTNATAGVYEVTAGDYNAEIYYVTTGNKLVREAKSGNNYVLDNATYYIKVFSDKKGSDFQFGSYNLQLTDKSVYSTIQKAYDLGDWEFSYAKRPEVVPVGQQEAYYKFSIDNEDKVYASFILSLSDDGTLIEFLDNTGKTVDYGFSGSDAVPDLPVRGVVKRSNSSLSNLVVNIDGTQTNGVGYIRVTKVHRMSFMAGGTPSLTTRIRSGFDTFSFSGTASNPGNSTSSVLTLNLTNSSKVPPHAVVDRITTSGSMSYNVGGVHHQLNPGGMGWLTSAYTNPEDGSFNIGTEYNIGVKQPWGFRYTQTAFMSTTLSRVTMKIYWDYDIQYTNYELFK